MNTLISTPEALATITACIGMLAGYLYKVYLNTSKKDVSEKDLFKEVQTLHRSLLDLATANNSLQAEILTLKQRIADLTDENRSLQDTIKQLTAKVNQLTEQNSRLLRRTKKTTKTEGEDN